MAVSFERASCLLFSLALVTIVAYLAPIVFPAKLLSHDFNKIDRNFPHSGHIIFPAQRRLNRTAGPIPIITTAPKKGAYRPLNNAMASAT